MDGSEPEATLIELKSYYWLSTTFQNFQKKCDCSHSENLKLYITKIKSILNNNNIVLDPIYRSCDVCKVLPCEIFPLLNIACKIKDSNEMNSMLIELQYHAILLMLLETEIGLCSEPCDHIADLRFSTNTISEFLHFSDLNKLRESVYFWKKASIGDGILSQIDVLPITSFFESNEVFINDEQTAYLDFNIFGKYEKDASIKEFLTNAINSNKITFLCSPTHLEEMLRMCNDEYERIRLQSLKDVTKELSIVTNKENLVFCQENFDGRLQQVKKYSELNNFAEMQHCAHVETLEQLFESYMDENKRRSIATSSLTTILNNFNKSTGEKINSNLPSEVELNKLLMFVGFNHYSINEYKDLMSKDNIDFHTLRTAIASLSSLFNIIGLHADKSTYKNNKTAVYPLYGKESYRTVRSSYYDNEHLSFATKCKYFVTTDKKLFKKAKEIYDYLGCKTIPLLLGDFIDILERQ